MFLYKAVIPTSEDFTGLTSKYEQTYLEGQIHYFVFQVPPALLLNDSAGRIARELW
jgi:hypothetical protein